MQVILIKKNMCWNHFIDGFYLNHASVCGNIFILNNRFYISAVLVFANLYLMMSVLSPWKLKGNVPKQVGILPFVGFECLPRITAFQILVTVKCCFQWESA